MNIYLSRFKVNANKILLENNQNIIRIKDNPYIKEAFKDLLDICKDATAVIQSYLNNNVRFYGRVEDRPFLKDKRYLKYRNDILEMVDELAKYEYSYTCQPGEHYCNTYVSGFNSWGAGIHRKHMDLDTYIHDKLRNIKWTYEGNRSSPTDTYKMAKELYNKIAYA